MTYLAMHCPLRLGTPFAILHAMAINRGIFGDTTSFEHRYISDHKRLEELVQYWKKLGLKIVLTSGTFDLFHIGHAQYLEKAKALGDLLIIGVDSDAKVKERKGPHRPIVPELERVQILSHCRHADVITLKGVGEPKNHLIRIVSPDVLVVSESTKHAEGEVDEKAQYCGEIVVMEPQSETSTSAKLRLIQISHNEHGE
jgi:rfaE bifunctional protein nucleotidyltransferase chain/domain